MDGATKIKIIVAVVAVQILLLAFWFWPYSDDFTVGYQEVAAQVLDIIEKDPTSNGVSKARQYFNSREDRLKDRFKFGLKPEKNGAVSESVRSRYQDVVNKGTAPLDLLADKHPDISRDIESLTVDMGMQRLGY